MQIRIDLKICIILLIFFLTNQIEVYLIFMLFAILHELGHLVMGLILGFKPKGISLFPLGLSICFHVKCENYNINVKGGKVITFKKLLITLAGPITNFCIAVFFMFFNIEIFGITRDIIIYSNFLIGLFNLIPIYPLDGGRIVRCIIHMKKDLRKSYEYTNIISNITIIVITAISSIAILYFKNIAILLIVMYLWILVVRENIMYNKKMHLYKLMDDIGREKDLYEYDMKL